MKSPVIESLSAPQRLMLALLWIVYLHGKKCRKPRCHICRADTVWLNDLDETYLFSFIRCCEQLGLEPHQIRHILQRGYGAKEHTHGS